ncbi:hypothetical protein [Phytomonospora endophytica]|uniref:Thymidylate kinase n=1 Tax=Phytomonospora endophytica TaxID=714109 RepID=A0A841FQU1_9ACTN|nr:hypothetical protein [Phytomonospora endophytica]MBB6038204.1 thymidylate kinase [Phytomonospora endophytica]GIG67337.1 hypothetical protein Pen01_36320 [Phytomonospora endophytica]
MSVEAQRVACVDELAAHGNPLTILDRSVDTLLAHAYALDQLLGFDVHRRVRARIQVLPHLRPDLTIYIDTPIDTLTARRATQGHPAELYFLHDPEFLRHTRDYFLAAPVPPASDRIITVNGNNAPDAIAAYVAAVVEHERSRA